MPFDLAKAPAFRIRVYRCAGGENILSLVVHHIVADLWSMDIVLADLRALYLAERAGTVADLAPPRATYGDFVRWQAQKVAGPEGAKALEFWRGQLAGDLEPLCLPTARPRPRVQTYDGDAHTWPLPQELNERLRSLAVRKTTLFGLLLAAYQVLLHRLAGQEEIVLGTATAGRSRTEWEDLVGISSTCCRSARGSTRPSPLPRSWGKSTRRCSRHSTTRIARSACSSRSFNLRGMRGGRRSFSQCSSGIVCNTTAEGNRAARGKRGPTPNPWDSSPSSWSSAALRST